MKTITMDFKLYQEEIRQAKVDAIEGCPALIEKLDYALLLLSDGYMTAGDFSTAISRIRTVRDTLKGVEV